MTLFAVCVVVSNVVGLVTYAVDVYSDLALGVFWLRRGHRNWGAATLGFFFFPGFLNSLLGVVFAHRFFIGPFRVVAFVLCGLFAAPAVSSLERILRRVAKNCRVRWDVWVSSTGEVAEGEGAGLIASIGSRQRAIEVTLEAIPQIGLQLYIAAKQNALGGLQFFTLLSSTVGAVLTGVYALDDVMTAPIRRNLFDCSNVFRPALAIGAGFWCLLALLAHLPAVAFFGAVTHGAALILGVVLYLEGALTALPLHLGKRKRTVGNRVLVGVPSLTLHCVLTGIVILLAQMWFIRVKTYETGFIKVGSTSASTPESKYSIPEFIWPNPAWPLSVWKKKQELEVQDLIRSLKEPKPTETSDDDDSENFPFVPAWAECAREKLADNGTFFTKEWWRRGKLSDNVKELASKDLTCLTDHADEVMMYLMWIDALFFLIQFAVLTFLNLVDTRAVNV